MLLSRGSYVCSAESNYKVGQASLTAQIRSIVACVASRSLQTVYVKRGEMASGMEYIVGGR